jgi:hypothetical protein
VHFRIVTLKKLQIIVLVLIGLLLSVTVSAAQPLQVRVDRWLDIQQIAGNVTYLTPQRSLPARLGMRLQTVGEGVSTAVNSRTVLGVDTGIGTIQVAERTSLRIRELQLLPTGGRVTRLQVASGQARVQVRRFTHPDSELEIETPAGLSGVRGTVFGVTVHPDGKMGIATLEGAVNTAAQGKSVLVDAGFQNLTIPGEPPSPAVPIEAAQASLQLRLLTAVGSSSARVVGRIDPVNLLKVQGQQQVTDRNGDFDLTVAMPSSRRIEVAVTTPLGTQQVYELAVPRR